MMLPLRAGQPSSSRGLKTFRRVAAVACFAVLSACHSAQAQSTDAFANFGTNAKDPIQIEADRLVIQDQDRKAVFSGNVHVVQGEMSMRAENLVVHYLADRTKKASGEANAVSGKGQRINRIEADGNITVKQNDQTATGDRAVYDAAQQTVRLTGNVVLSQGASVLRGDSLVVDLRTRSSRVESSGSKSGRVFFLGVPGSGRDKGPPERKGP